MNQYTKPLLWTATGAIGITALWAAFIVGFGTFSELQVKILATTFIIGYYGMTTAATFGEGKEHLVLGTAGIVLAIVGLFMTLPEIWSPTFGGSGKGIVSVGLLATSLAIMTTNYRLSTNVARSVAVMAATNILVGLSTVILLWLILTDFRNVGDGIIRTLGVLAILGVGAMIINPIVAKISRKAADA